ncbi:hypothetical protein [Rhizobium leguminosarum]|uniref:hypothetical protein n=1 Tax=Rhizobium leguminosarum TaxID=384 RepID=UPI001C9697BA|nr:hypothetical protein [Rhizobium leguminosarum]MBY5750807.1 hypothetical protein [Rhizobium leguminosarum]
MTNVLLTRKYKGHPAGEILKDIPDTEANGLVTLGLAKILKEEEQSAPKKSGKGADAE